jgi:hypothetical protein
VATSDPNPHAVVFDTFDDTQTNDNFASAQAKDNPIISAETNLSINQQTSDAVKRTSPKSNKHTADQPKITRDERRKRVRAEVFENTGELRLLHSRQIELIRTSISGLPRFRF